MFVTSKFFDNFIMLCVVTNTIILAMEGIVDTKVTAFTALNLIFTIIFGSFKLIFDFFVKRLKWF